MPKTTTRGVVLLSGVRSLHFGRDDENNKYRRAKGKNKIPKAASICMASPETRPSTRRVIGAGLLDLGAR